MTHQAFARGLLALFCMLQGAGTVAVDLNRTHAMHPGWIGHARFHVVWQIATTAFLSAFEAMLILWQGPLESERFYAAAVLASMPALGFFTATATRRIYGGTLSDPGGIPPLRLTIGGRERRIDLNVITEIAGLITVVLMVGLYQNRFTHR